MRADGLESAWVLHTRRYGDSSLLVDMMTPSHGRLACMAKGALRARRAAAPPQSFQPLLVALRGRGEVLTLVRHEAAGAPLSLAGQTLFCGLYVNELLLKLTPRQDPSPALFDDYARTIEGLAGGLPREPVLRAFEVRMLDHLGLGLDVENDSAGRPVVAGTRYTYHVHDGATAVMDHAPESIDGATLLALRDGDFSSMEQLREARLLMRRVLDFHLDGRPLRTRELFR